jgi:hypothetical protein
MKPPSSTKSEFSKREIVLFVLGMIVASVLTIAGTYFFLKTFVLRDPRDLHSKFRTPFAFQNRGEMRRCES